MIEYPKITHRSAFNNLLSNTKFKTDLMEIIELYDLVTESLILSESSKIKREE